MPTSCPPVTRAMLGVELPAKGGVGDASCDVSDDPALQPTSADSAIAADTNEACFTTHSPLAETIAENDAELSAALEQRKIGPNPH